MKTIKFSFRFRMIFSMMAIAVVCVVSIATLSYIESKNTIEQNYISVLDEKLTLQAERFDETMKELYLAVQQLSCSDELADNIQSYLDGAQGYADGVALSQSLSDLSDFSQMDSAVWLYVSETEQMFSSLVYYPVQEMDDLYLVRWENDTYPYAPLFYMNVFAKSSQYVYAYAHEISDEDGNVLATVCITVEERQLYYDLLGSLNSTQGEEYMILNVNGTISSAAHLAQTRKRMTGMAEEQTGRVDAQVGTDGMLYTSVEAPFSHYRLMCCSDLSTLTDTLRRDVLILVALVLAVFLVMIGVAVFVSNQLYRPIREMVEAMDQVGQGDFAARVPVRSHDEFAVVGTHFNEMMTRMEDMTQKVVQEEMEKREAEINALQYQIRPHFMYNTLNSIRFAAMLQGNTKLADMLDDYIALLEASVQRKGAFVTLGEEIELVKNYLSLQAFRYFDCFEAEYQIDPDTEECYVPCLLLQPVIENAVFHGIDPKRNDNRVSIRAEKQDGQLVLTVRDNGSGFALEKEEQKEEQRRLTGIGLRNIKQRLQLYYGEQASFQISSRSGVGTTVEIRIPVSDDPEEYSIRKESANGKA